ncbi:hypothetical protein TSUD_18650 [Trifolium subterraneum]|uniref:Protein kinase domain-containing protein n=1 Tax=Trifolium subterraneum TaxID=3900 RepID=A0A2Z6N393_TRISU|nr:hypothetical protein TSUD_18650 [Trifolium subterraneum]
MLGAAKGLAFLHEEAEKPLIYRDFKTSNILLDSQYNAKLSDFGLAKDAPTGDKTHVSTQVMGTQGYVDPLYVVSGFHQLIDPKLEGIYSARGAYKAFKLVSLCLSRDQNSRPLMSEIAKVLQNILDCKIDMPPLKIKSNSHVGPSSSSPVSSTPTRFRASPLDLTATFPSPNPPCGENP